MPRRRLHALRRLVGVLYFDGFDDVADTKLGDDVFAFDGLAEHGIAGIEVMLGAETQVELRARGIGIHGTCHGERTVLVGIIGIRGVFLLDGVAGTARTQSSERIAGGSDDLVPESRSRVLGQPP